MVAFSAPPPPLSSEVVSLYYTRDALLENLPALIFYGASTTGNSTQNGSRIQAHIYTLAGFQSFPRLTISPSSPLYAAVYHLPADQQGDQLCRGLAVSLLSYFAGMSEALKDSLKEMAASRRPNRVAPAMFDEMHAGDVASRMVKVEDTGEMISSITGALRAQSISWLDVDVVLPSESIRRVMATEASDHAPSFGEDGLPLFHYGEHDSLVNLLGSPTFLPTSKLRRAPSKPTAHSKSRSLLKDQKIALRQEMCELVDTEGRYLGKLDELVNSMALGFRQGLEGSSIIDKLFPQSLSSMLQVNKDFYDDIQEILQLTENEAISDIEGAVSEAAAIGGRKRDPTGIAAFAKTLLRWFPKFTGPYQEFMRASTIFPSILHSSLQDTSSNFSRLATQIGEQRLRSALIEPVQRLPRYSLFIDNMVNQLPASHPGLANLLKARDIITDICALDTNSLAQSNRTVSFLKTVTRNWPASFSPRSRLITAVDVRELAPPYQPSGEGQASMLLLFSEALLLLKKTDEVALSARGLMTEVDGPSVSTMTTPSLNSCVEKGLICESVMPLDNLQLTESDDNNMIWVTCSEDASSKTGQHQSVVFPQPITKVFSLIGAYERKSTRLCEEVARARMEGRFPESMRENDKWALRTISTPFESLSILAAIWEGPSADVDSISHGLSRTRIIVDKEESCKALLAKNKELDIVASITSFGHDHYHLRIECVNGDCSADDTLSDSLAVLLVQRCMPVERARLITLIFE